MNKFIPWVAATVAAIVAIGCGGSNDTQFIGNSPRVRAVNAIYGPDRVEVRFNGDTGGVRSLNYGDYSQYAIIDNTQTRVTFTEVGTGQQVSADTRLFRNNTYYTIIANGGTDQVRDTIVTEDRTANPSSNVAEYRVVHAAKGIGNVDVYLDPGETLEENELIAADMENRVVREYRQTQPGTHTIVVRDDNNRTFATQEVNLQGGQVQKLVLIREGDNRIRVIVVPEGD